MNVLGSNLIAIIVKKVWLVELTLYSKYNTRQYGQLATEIENETLKR